MAREKRVLSLAMEHTHGIVEGEILEDMEVKVILEVGMEVMEMDILEVDIGMDILEVDMEMVTPEVDMEVTAVAMVQGEDMEGTLEVADMEDLDTTGDEHWIIIFRKHNALFFAFMKLSNGSYLIPSIYFKVIYVMIYLH